MDERHGHFRRRGLFGLLGRGARGLRDALGEGAEALRPGGGPGGASSYDRIERPAEECIEGRPDGFEAYTIARKADFIQVGTSLTVRGEDLPETIVLVAVTPTHFAACSGECPVDGSDLVWAPALDRVLCPGCQSLWRMDGDPVSGPAASQLQGYSVDREPDGMRITRW